MGGMIAAIEAGSRRARSPTPATATSARSRRGEQIIVGVNRFTAGRRAADRTAADRRSRSAGARRPSWRRCARGAITAQVHGALDALRRAAAGTREHDAVYSGRRARLRHPGRDLRRAARCLRHVPGSEHDLVARYSGTRTMTESECWWPSPGWTATTAAPR